MTQRRYLSPDIRVAWLCVCATGALLLSCRAGAEQPADFDYGFVASRDVSLDGAERVRALGPFYESRVYPDGRKYAAFRPFYSRVADPGEQSRREEYLWPLASAKEAGGQKTWRVATALYTDFDPLDPGGRYRFWLLPFLFRGRDAQGNEYAAVFPIGGTISEFLMYDKLQFVLFPAYYRSLKQDRETLGFMWPIVSITRGEDVSRMRFFPIYARAVEEGESVKTFILWPLLTFAEHLRPGTAGKGFILFPILGHTKREKEESWMFVPPLFRWTVGPGRRELYAPWPFVQVSSGRIDKLYLWPIVGRKHEKDMRSGFLLWPFITSFERRLNDQTLSRFVFLPFVQTEVRRGLVDAGSGAKGALIRRKVKIWPLMSFRKDAQTSSLRVPALWPAVDVPSIERNYAPFWTLYSRERSAGKVENEVLWGLFRHRSSETEKSVSLFPLVSWRRSRENGGEKEWSLLKGLIGYRREGDRKTVRLLYLLKLGGKSHRNHEGT